MKRDKRNKQVFIFTDDAVRGLQKQDNNLGYDFYHDRNCPHLMAAVSASAISYFYMGNRTTKIIGNAWRISVEDARDIVRNVDAHPDEFLALDIPAKQGLYDNWQKNGPLPRTLTGTYKTNERPIQEQLLQLEVQLKKERERNLELMAKLDKIYNIIAPEPAGATTLELFR